MFRVTATARDGRWVVETTEGSQVTFVGWYRTLAEAEMRREIEEARLRKKHPTEALDLRP